MTTARAASTAARAARNWQECSIHVKISPRPQNLAESRQVMRVLQQYGEVVMYRHLKVSLWADSISEIESDWAKNDLYESPDPTLNAALAIYRNQTSAHNAINASPIRFHLQQSEDGWISRISQDASLEGVTIDSTNVNAQKESDSADESCEQAPTSDSHEGPFYNRVPREEGPSYDASAHDEAVVFDAPALVGPEEKWGKFLEALERRSAPPEEGSNDTPTKQSSDPPKTLESSSVKKRSKKPAQSMAEELAAHSQASPSRRRETEDGPRSPAVQVKEFELTIAQSVFNHQAYIERQGYYAGFNPDMKTIMAADLRGRVPLEGLADCRLSKGDVPLRQRLLRKERAARPRQTLREIWEAGRKSRGEEV
ncbi:MAG: hypothetical protein L6R37_007869 [Teloschistes peruensis]|nr:MAG: hypothetical protein L6R37_007869 [Teloschistes peruensis]